MPGFIIVAIVFASTLGLVKMGLDYSKAVKLQESQRSSDDRSLKTSELQALIREAVKDEVGPLSDRIDRIEQKMLPPAKVAGDSAEDDDADEPAESPRPEPDVVHPDQED